MITLLSLFFSLLSQQIDYKRTLIIFFSTIAAYNFICFYEKWENKGISKISFYLFIISIIMAVLLTLTEVNTRLIVNMLFLGVLVIMYNSKIISLSLRSIALLKIFIISFVWTYAIFWIGNSIDFSPTLFLSLFLFILGITIPFDIQDMEEDNILTIPKWIGVQKSKYLSYLSLIISTILFYITFYQSIYIDYVIGWGIACFIAMVLILMMKKKPDFSYTRFWIEAAPSFPLFLLILIQKNNHLNF